MLLVMNSVAIYLRNRYENKMVTHDGDPMSDLTPDGADPRRPRQCRIGRNAAPERRATTGRTGAGLHD
ncbi:MAG: hypothetical protein V9E83_01855 [Baekduia sp.]